MEQQFIIPKFPLWIAICLLVVVAAELIGYGITIGVPSVWAVLIFGGFYLAYSSIFHKDTLPIVFTLLFLTAYHSLILHVNRDLQIAVLFMAIFAVNSLIMWILLHYATHLKPEYHMAYSLICGFMIAQIITLFGSLARDWPFRFELASYMPTVFSYIFWRFACLSAESVLGWKQFVRVAILVVILISAIILGSPNVQV